MDLTKVILAYGLLGGFGPFLRAAATAIWIILFFRLLTSLLFRLTFPRSTLNRITGLGVSLEAFFLTIGRPFIWHRAHPAHYLERWLTTPGTQKAVRTLLQRRA